MLSKTDLGVHFDSIILSAAATDLENALKNQGFSPLVGIDEAGRGPLAGPVVASACSISEKFLLSYSTYLKDSKKCTAREREELYLILTQSPEVLFSVSIVSHEVVDQVNILQATMQAMTDAVLQLPITPKAILVDGNRVPLKLQKSYYAHPVVKGDQFVPSISAASIIAKVTRDRIVDAYDEMWPHFQFKRHKGYGTELHRLLLQQYGPLPVHRKTFEPIKSQLTASLLLS